MMKGRKGAANHEFQLSIIERGSCLSSVSQHSELHPTILILHPHTYTNKEYNILMNTTPRSGQYSVR